MTPSDRRKKWAALLCRVALIVLPFSILSISHAFAQNPDVGTSVQPDSRVRLTGVLKPGEDTLVPSFPQIRVWIGGKPWLLQVCDVEPLIPAYRAEEALRKISGLGLRLVTNSDELTTLRQLAAKHQPLVIEGQLRVHARRLQVETVHTAQIVARQCPLNRTTG